MSTINTNVNSIKTTVGTINTNASNANTNAANAKTAATNAYNAITNFANKKRFQRFEIVNASSGMDGGYTFHNFERTRINGGFSYSSGTATPSTTNLLNESCIRIDLSNFIDSEVKNVIANNYGYYLNWGKYYVSYKYASSQSGLDTATTYTTYYINDLKCFKKLDTGESTGKLDLIYNSSKYYLYILVGGGSSTGSHTGYFTINSINMNFEIFY